jgi:hypothetical protein
MGREQNTNPQKHTVMHNAEFLIPISFFAMILGIVYMSYRKKERMALIQSGRDASILKEDGRCYSSLKWGLLLFGVGLGLLIAEFMAKYDVMSAEAAYFSMASIFGGMALIIDFFIEKYRKESDPEPAVKE